MPEINRIVSTFVDINNSQNSNKQREKWNILMVFKSATDVGGKCFWKCHRKPESSLTNLIKSRNSNGINTNSAIKWNSDSWISKIDFIENSNQSNKV